MTVLRQNFGIYVIAAWSVILGILNLIRLFYTLGFGFDQFKIQAPLAQIHLYQWTSLAFSLAFLAAAVGLWQKQNWGRLLFSALALLYFALSIFGVWGTEAGELPSYAKWRLTGRYILSALLPLIYLNLAFIKKIFAPKQL